MAWIVKVERCRCRSCGWRGTRQVPKACPRCGAEAVVGEQAWVRWKASYRDPSGDVRSRSFTRKEDASRWLARVDVSRQEGTYADPALGRVTYAQVWEDFVSKAPNLRPATVELYRRMSDLYVLPIFGARRVATITRKEVEDWIADLQVRGVGPPTIEASYRVLRRVLNRAVTGGNIVRNPATGIAVPKAPKREMRFLEARELALAVDAAPDRYRALILLLGLSGLRIGEALALQVGDLDILRRRVSITKAAAEVRGEIIVGETKTGRSRGVSISPVVAEALAAHLAVYAPKEGGVPRRDSLVFTSQEGTPIRRTNFRRRVWLPAVRKAGIRSPRPRVHDLRHTAVALAIQAGAHPKAVQEMLGHSKITMTLDRYGHLFPALSEQLAERVDALFRAASPGAEQLAARLTEGISPVGKAGVSR